jgi:NAD(P)-dependent dehydrogenase (short-subunit alcohol dehydrogenase family)
MRIEGASALVAGGASGLGAATAWRLRAAGAAVTIADLNAEAGTALAAELGARFVACDVTDAAQVRPAGALRMPPTRASRWQNLSHRD